MMYAEFNGKVYKVKYKRNSQILTIRGHFKYEKGKWFYSVAGKHYSVETSEEMISVLNKSLRKEKLEKLLS